MAMKNAELEVKIQPEKLKQEERLDLNEYSINREGW